MAAPQVPIYQPNFKVTLYKTIKRQATGEGAPVSERYKGANRTIDLTPFMGEGGGLRTSKSVKEPAGGFTLVMSDAPDKHDGNFETLYGLIEPMDFIEMRVRHGTLDTGSVDIPVVMRGFVSRVSRSESMDASGRPSRRVVVMGQDYGKLWQMLQILYLPGYVIGQDFLSDFKLFEQFGVAIKSGMSGKELVQQVFDKVVNPYLKTLMPSDTTNPTAIKMDFGKGLHGTTSLTGAQNAQGSIHSILTQYCDVGPWNEMFIEDREDGVYLVYRPNPYRTVGVGGKTKNIHEDGDELPVLDISDRDLSEYDVSRSDQNVANHFWVRGARFDLNTDVYRKQAAVAANDDTVVLKDYPNATPKLYGIRLMQVDSQMGGDDLTVYTSGQDQAQQGRRDVQQADWLTSRRKLLVEMNRDNVVLEEGSMRITGNEQVRVGSYVRLYRGGFSAEHYITGVSHEYTPFSGYFTTLTFIRGMGFVERSKREGGPDSPYLSEMRETRLSKPGAQQ